MPGKLGLGEDETIRRICEQCGWDLKVLSRPAVIPQPTREDIIKLRYLDPDGHFRGC